MFARLNQSNSHKFVNSLIQFNSGGKTIQRRIVSVSESGKSINVCCPALQEKPTTTLEIVSRNIYVIKQ